MNVSRRHSLLCGLILPFTLQASVHAAARGSTGYSSLAYSRFGNKSTAEEVTAGLRLKGKTALITGCNSGIGYETMRVLVMRGARVLGLARNIEKAERACAAVNTSDALGEATPFACEQAVFSSVVKCANDIQELRMPIDILICNAGVFGLPQLELAEGLEKHFVVNHLSHFILVNRLLNRVKSSRQGRIVVVSSAAAYFSAPQAGIEFDNLSGQHHWDSLTAYGQSKLANVLFVRELSRRLSKTQATANAVEPGGVLTEGWNRLAREFPGFEEGRSDLKTPEQGAATTCYVATSPELASISGEYFADCKIAAARGRMRDDALAAKLWDVSHKLTHGFL